MAKIQIKSEKLTPFFLVIISLLSRLEIFRSE